jgi:phosphoketolase
MGDMSHPGHLKLLEKWMKSYRPEELFDRTGRFLPELADLAPTGDRRMSAITPTAAVAARPAPADFAISVKVQKPKQ